MAVFYGGTYDKIKKQLVCDHDWGDACIDKISRYRKCSICYCMERDCNEEEYYEALHRSIPVSWELRQLFEERTTALIENGPGDNSKATMRLIKIMDAVKEIDNAAI